MAVVVISSSAVAARMIRYTLKPQNEAAAPRVLFSSGHNVTVEGATQAFAASRRIHGTDVDGQAQAHHLIQSFGLDELNPNNPEHVQRAHELGLALVTELYPEQQAVVVTQADGAGGQLHNHVVVNATATHDIEYQGKVWSAGRKLSGELTDIAVIRARHDAVLEREGFEQVLAPDAGRQDRKTEHDYRKWVADDYNWRDDLKDRIDDALVTHRPMGFDEFAAIMRDEHDVDARSRGSSWSARFLDDEGKQRVTRGHKLGDDFDLSALECAFDLSRRGLRPDRQRTEYRAPEHVPAAVEPGPTPAELSALHRKMTEMADTERLEQAVDSEQQAWAEELGWVPALDSGMAKWLEDQTGVDIHDSHERARWRAAMKAAIDDERIDSSAPMDTPPPDALAKDRKKQPTVERASKVVNPAPEATVDSEDVEYE